MMVLGCGSKSEPGDGGTDAEDGDVGPEDGGDVVPDPEEDVVDDGPCTRDEQCDDGDPCTEDTCDTTLGECEHDDVDADGDGYNAQEVDGTSCSGTDCDDDDESIHPDATEVCDMVDQDCDGSWADGGADDDGDDYLDETCGGDDCDDENAGVYPAAPLLCLDGVDQDCDGQVDGLMIADVQLTSAIQGSWAPQLVWTGSEIGIGWDDERNGAQDVYFMRVAADGTKIGSDVRVTDTTGYSLETDLAWSGSEFMTCWNDDRTGDRDVMCRRIGADGSLLGSEITVTTTTEIADLPDVVWADSQFGVVWEDRRHGQWDVYFQRVGADGSLLGSNVRVTDDASESYIPTMAWSGSEFVSCWQDTRDSVTQIYCARLSGGGTKIGAEVRVGATSNNSESAFLAWSGSEFGLAWVDTITDNEEIHFVRVATDLTRVGSVVRLTNDPDASENPWLAWTGSSYGVAWNDDRSGTWQIFAKHLSVDASTVSDDYPVSSGSSSAYYPSLAWNGSVFGVAWDEFLLGNQEIVFNLIEDCE
jgi:hypothetical protein